MAAEDDFNDKSAFDALETAKREVNFDERMKRVLKLMNAGILDTNELLDHVRREINYRMHRTLK